MRKPLTPEQKARKAEYDHARWATRQQTPEQREKRRKWRLDYYAANRVRLRNRVTPEQREKRLERDRERRATREYQAYWAAFRATPERREYMQIYNKAYKKAFRGHINELRRERYAANGERVKERERERYAANKDRINARRREQYAAKKAKTCPST
jgi:hypothetical protein